MDFDRELVALQTLLNCFDKHVKAVNELYAGSVETARLSGNIEKCIEKVTTNKNDANKRQTLRRMTFFLVLNTTSPRSEHLKATKQFAKLMVAPQLRPDVLLDIVMRLDLFNYLLEIIVFASPTLTVDLIKPLARKIIGFNVNDGKATLNAIEKTFEIIVALFRKIHLIKVLDTPDDRLLSTLDSICTVFNEMIVCNQQFFMDDTRQTNQRMKILSYTIQALLIGTNKCLQISTSSVVEAFPADFYLTERNITSTGVDIAPEFVESLHVYHTKMLASLLDLCSFALGTVNVMLYSYWAEKQFTNTTISMQDSIGFMCYELRENLMRHGDSDDASLQELFAKISSIEKKPPTIGEQVAMASAATINEHLNDPNNANRADWFAGLFKLPIHELLNTAVNHLDAIQDRNDLFERLLIALSQQPTIDARILTRFAEFPANVQSEIAYNVCSNCDYIPRVDANLITEIVAWLNRVTSDAHIDNVYVLLLQNAWLVLARLLRKSIDDYHLLPKYTLIIERLARFYRLKRDGQTILLQTLNEIACADLSDSDKRNFVELTAKLVETRVLDMDDAIKFFFDLIRGRVDASAHGNDAFGNFECYLQCVQRVITLETNRERFVASVIYLAEILIRTRWDINSFTHAAVTATQTVLDTIKIARGVNERKHLIDDSVMGVVKSHLRTTSLVNEYYFETLWNKWTLLEFVWPGTFHTKRRQHNVARMLEIFPFLTPEESQQLTDNIITETPSNAMEMFQTLVGSLKVLVKIATLSSASSSKTDLFKYTINNYAIVLNRQLPVCLRDQRIATGVCRATIELLALLPCQLQDECFSMLATVLVSLMGDCDNGQRAINHRIPSMAECLEWMNK